MIRDGVGGTRVSKVGVGMVARKSGHHGKTFPARLRVFVAHVTWNLARVGALYEGKRRPKGRGMEQVDRNQPDPHQVTALVRAAQAGDTMAVGDLLDLVSPYVRRLCGPIALDEGADATQEALIVIFRNLGQLRAPEALFAWVRTIAVREAVRVARRRGVLAEQTDLPALGDPELAVDMADVLGRLSPEHRAILLLREVEGLDEQHTARLLTVPVGTAKSRLSRARRSFLKKWQS